VSLATRMRKAGVHRNKPIQALVTGFRHGTQVVTAAAVMAVFAGSSESMVPAVLALLGKRAWWLPKLLDRALRNIGFEGERLRTLVDGDHREGPVQGPGAGGRLTYRLRHRQPVRAPRGRGTLTGCRVAWGLSRPGAAAGKRGRRPGRPPRRDR
jgi:hypothetical protein